MTIDNQGDARTYFDSFEAALADFSPPLENRPRIREIVTGLEYERIYIPSGRSYLALVPRDHGSIVEVHYGYVDGLRRPDGSRYWEELPVNAIRNGGYTQGAGRDDAPRDSCPTCFLELPVSGICGACDD